VPVEGYTNFLWTFLLGLLMLVGLRPEVTSLVLGTGFALGTLVVVFRLVERLSGGHSRWAYLAPALLALSSGYACWSSGGLETQMFTFWVTLALWGVAATADRPGRLRLVGLALALAAMTRPEGLLVAAIVGVHRLAWNLMARRRPIGRDELAAAAVFLAIWGPWFAWRWWYYGQLFPNTYYVKAAGAAHPGYESALMKHGLYYVAQWARQTRLMWAWPVAIVGLVVARRSPRLIVGSLALLITVVYLAYTVRVGGDFMGLHRFVMPLFAIAAIGVTLGLRLIASLIRRERLHTVVGVTVGVAVVVAFGVDQRNLTIRSMATRAADNGIDTPGYLALYAHDRAAIGRHMRECFRPDDFSIFGGVGAKPYYARAKGIDVFGLVSSRIAHEVPRTNPRPGHNKWGPDPLLAEYDPTFVFSCYSLHRDPTRPRLNCNPGFWLRRGFEQVTLHIPGLLERGEYYTFLVKKDREFACPGLVQ
jgi:hypothetical protein